MGFFQWIRSSVKAAVLGGFQDAADELKTISQEVEPVTLQLEQREEPAERANGRTRAR